ncbi:uncharacterized protein K452DRAFT_132538 [Aplosporella prunicola CBS 121167]|uniref:Uncharacterized protein n=1 Tax=Aplosporella prunicola CBS 121167 TaxID=1176127 RepID=A0A6A6BLD6_9PEZI|nr:uncharacterized protein K452DRAFT_132538 [Aplosporella prunicola CBS 121167]KAF2144929.1 hypothetical protein K452DRAFT_132538 [Aplosporella prunicola CBS 121167]
MFMAAVCPQDATIRVYSIRARSPVLKCVLSPRELGLDDKADPPQVTFEVMLTAFHDMHSLRERYQCMEKLAVLYRYRVLGVPKGPFMQEASRQSEEVLKLVTWRFTSSFDVSIENIRDVYLEDGFEPTAMAVDEHGTAMITFKKSGGLRAASPWKMTSYSKSSSKYYDSFPHMTTYTPSLAFEEQNEPPPDAISLAQNTTLLSNPGNPTPYWFIDDRRLELRGNISVIISSLTISAEQFTGPSLGIPFAAHHTHRLKDVVNDEEYCINSVLQLYIQTSGVRRGAYIIKGVQYPPGDERYDMRRHYPSLEHFVVAQLVGLPLTKNSLSSLGTIVAISPGGTRIAMASWDRVLVWAIRPTAFFKRWLPADSKRSRVTDALLDDSSDSSSSVDLDGESDSPKPPSPSTDEEEDHAYLHRCGHDYYASNPLLCFPHTQDPHLDYIIPPSVSAKGGRKQTATTTTSSDTNVNGATNNQRNTNNDDSSNSIVCLEPVELPRQGVVFSLSFGGEDNSGISATASSENVLWAWTDRGAVRWSFRPGCRGERDTEKLEWEVSEGAEKGASKVWQVPAMRMSSSRR